MSETTRLAKAIAELKKIPEIKAELEGYKFCYADRIYLKDSVTGKTHYSHRTVAVCKAETKEIIFAAAHLLCMSWEETIETLCHEIAHINTYEHGNDWKRKFNRLLDLVPFAVKYNEPNNGDDSEKINPKEEATGQAKVQHSIMLERV